MVIAEDKPLQENYVNLTSSPLIPEWKLLIGWASVAQNQPLIVSQLRQSFPGRPVHRPATLGGGFRKRKFNIYNSNHFHALLRSSCRPACTRCLGTPPPLHTFSIALHLCSDFSHNVSIDIQGHLFSIKSPSIHPCPLGDRLVMNQERRSFVLIDIQPSEYRVCLKTLLFASQ